MTDTIPVDLIDPPTAPVRRRPAPPSADQELDDSIGSLGILQPVLVTPEGSRYRLVAGSRRLAAAKRLGFETIPAYVQRLDEACAQGAAMAENITRQPMDEADKWRAFRRLRETGTSLATAGAWLGFTPRRVDRLDRLARLPEEVLALVDAWGPPDPRAMTVVLQSDPKKLAKLAKQELKLNPGNEHWFRIVNAVEQRRFNRADAVFDTETAKIAWDEDLFAEPDNPRRFTTTETDRFLKLQQQAIGDEINRRSRKEDVAFAELNQYGQIGTPKGFTQEYGAKSLKRGWAERIVIDTRDGTVHRYYFKPTPKPARAEKPAAGEPDTADDRADEAAPPEKRGLTKAGLAMVANAKTEALRKRLAQRDLSAEELLALAVFAFAASNVSVSGGFRAEEGGHVGRDRFLALAAGLLAPGGTAAPDIDEVAHQLLATVFEFTGPNATTYSPGSGDAAEWAATLIDAQKHLGRFDTPEFLATVPTDELRQAAEAAGLAPKKTATAKTLRELLAGNAPDWRPAAAHFGAPAPQFEHAADDDEDDPGAREFDEEEDAGA